MWKLKPRPAPPSEPNSNWLGKDSDAIFRRLKARRISRNQNADQLDADVVVGVGADDVENNRITLRRRHAERQRVMTSVDPLAVTICQSHYSTALRAKRVRYAV